MRKLMLLLATMLPTAAHAAAYPDVIARVAAMVEDQRAQELVQRRGLSILNVMWEDTGRYLGSSVGPNISDVTIEVQDGQHTTLMPVIRHDDFTDKTGDVKMDAIRVPVGNQADGALETISLTELLRDPIRYMSLPQKGRIKSGTLLAPRDSHVLVSAQTAFLPVPHEGKATFWPVIFNYQSTKRNPGVLAILVTRQGTSMTIVDNARDSVGGDWGQRLFFNDHGKRAPLVAERRSDVEAHGVTANGESAASLGENANVMMLIQVPLRMRQRRYLALPAPMKSMAMEDSALAGDAAPMQSRRARDVETAVLGHGPQLGPFTELDGLTIDRDPRFPVRVTVQFYQATSTGHIAATDVKRFAQQIQRVYKQADYVGSLVVPAKSDLARPTRWTHTTPPPATLSLWDFPGLAERRGMIDWSGLTHSGPLFGTH